MLRINALIFLFIIQFLLISAGLSIFLFFKYRKQAAKGTISQGEIRRLESEIETRKNEITALLKWKDMFTDLQKNFDQIKSVNQKLKEAVDTLVPEAERSKEFAQLITEIEQSNQELDTCLGTLKKENESLNQNMQAFKDQISGLSGKLQNSVSKKEFQKILDENDYFQTQTEKLREDLKHKTKEHEKLEKNFIYLEKEYNALYRDTHGNEVPPS